MRLREQVAIVTGASCGIGAEIALELAREGADVVVNYCSTPDGAREVEEQIGAMGRRALVVRADVAEPTEVREMVDATISEFGRIDILVNNAAVALWTPFDEITDEVWFRTINVNLTGTFLCSRDVARVMKRQRSGKIINITTVGAERGQGHLAHYNASKGGVNALTRAMAIELGPQNINVIGVGPGPIAVQRNLDRLPDFRETVGQRIPLRRSGEVEDISKVVAFLASPDAGYITGQILYVDGGELAQLHGTSDDELI